MFEMVPKLVDVIFPMADVLLFLFPMAEGFLVGIESIPVRGDRPMNARGGEFATVSPKQQRSVWPKVGIACVL